MYLIRNSQFLTTFGTTGGQHAAAVCSEHSLTEAVLVVATAIVGLKCSFHCYVLFC